MRSAKKGSRESEVQCEAHREAVGERVVEFEVHRKAEMERVDK